MKYVSKQKEGNFNSNLSYSTNNPDNYPNQWSRWRNYSRRATADMARQSHDGSFSYQSYAVFLEDHVLKDIVEKQNGLGMVIGETRKSIGRFI